MRGELTELRFVSEILEVGSMTSDSGVPASEYLFGPHKDPEVRKDDPRGYPTGTGLSDGLWAQRAGLDLDWLTNTELFSPELYFLSRLPADLDVGETTAVVVMALALSLLATLYPSWRAARLDPVEALRYE